MSVGNYLSLHNHQQAEQRAYHSTITDCQRLCSGMDLSQVLTFQSVHASQVGGRRSEACPSSEHHGLEGSRPGSCEYHGAEGCWLVEVARLCA